MTKTFRLAHISDLHLNPDYFPERTIRFRSLLAQCKRLGTDHIVITGDITNQAKQDEWEHFRNVLKEFSLLDGSRATVVVGNHDIYGGPYHAEDVFKFPAACKATDYDMKLNEFYANVKETFAGVKFFSSGTVFPFLKILDDVAIVGLNSVARWSTVKNPIGSNGKIDDVQYEALQTIMHSSVLKGKQIIVAVHHHFNATKEVKAASKVEKLWRAFESATMKMYKKKRLLKLFRAGSVKAILHGHIHHHGEYDRGGVHCLNAGGSIVPSTGCDPSFHLIDLSGTTLTVQSISAQASLLLGYGRKKKERERIPARRGVVSYRA